MIEIIKPKPKKYKMICHQCDCEFYYQLSDLTKEFPLNTNKVRCPECGEYLEHYNREKIALEMEGVKCE